MWTILGISLVLFLIVGMDGIPLWKKKDRKGLIVFISVLSIGASLLLYQSVGFTIPTPLHWIKTILYPITESFYPLFK
ncbi:hypothetical protein [Pseudalkalibacillus berkeleyi]|uniref:Uncharacterized protein n=1 Tax=Pseudalkalibacillus berkeleyi TaxID=1069813 RepID=A0ABS9H0U8_9BACL|nr:hypothetical protein [Pseudalkalibacillus berkeleyi]MCF6137463.1 hypothetical protein [Pseudalkalibacillus berkeleyi]